MPAFEERLAYVEGRMEEHSRSVDGIREALVSLERRNDARFDGVDRRLDGVERRFNVLDSKIDLVRDALDQKMSRHFLWLVGIEVTTLVAIVGALLAR